MGFESAEKDGLLYDAYVRAFSFKQIISAGAPRIKDCSFKSFMKHKKELKRLTEEIQSDIYSGGKLIELKREFIIYKVLHTRIKKRLKGRKNKASEKAEIGELSTDEILRFIFELDLKQYEKYFSDNPYAGRLAPCRLARNKFMKFKRLSRILREGTLLEVYQIIYSADKIKLKIEQALLENPKELYPAARAMNRRFFIHCGGTNTGKTYNAVKALKSAETGVYLGPLRLLAMEIQENLLYDNVMCSLKTGEEEDIVVYATHVSSTVEMVDLYSAYDVAVIDECQMIGDIHRGCAWTRAVLGVRASEVHLCTAPEAVDILVRIIEDCGDAYEIIKYERRTPLEYDGSLASGAETKWENERGQYRRPDCASRLNMIKADELRYGDALIAFSRRDVLEIAELLHRRGINASVIYGDLPYETRKKQLRRFTERETSVIVATDAIGMGLNLPVRRVIFTCAHKFDGIRYRLLKPSEIKQIAGRAGRMGVYDKGLVFSVEEGAYIESSLTVGIKPIKKAYIEFDSAFIDMEDGMKEILESWTEAALPFDIYEKIDVKRTLALLSRLERLCGKKRLECDKETAYRLATITFDDGTREVSLIWQDYCAAYLSGADGLPLPKIRRDTVESLETSFKNVDLYYSFCRSMGYIPDMEWIDKTKKYLSDEINRRLLEML